MDTITIELYIDDVELAYPLGSHTGIRKFGFVYCTIKNLSKSLQSSLGSVFLANVYYSLGVEKYGCNCCGEKETQNETDFEPSEESENLPSISGYPFIEYPHFPEDDVEEPKTNEKRKYKYKLCGYKPKTKKGKRHHNITKHKIGVLLQQLLTLDANGRPLNFFSITETVIESNSETKEIIDVDVSYEKQMEWALRESAEMAAARTFSIKTRRNRKVNLTGILSITSPTSEIDKLIWSILN
ncbi:hypothetical protein NPIL_59371 [Nephila pilipes]|uniref:Uncharacterized protein n=1 Tax=Nephila pilipes TaxID=299642 RepID=A0A8X6NUY5_NEPPI|nr:hypothetical protein NPIL_59371 [Nephila pilipes]